MKNSSMAASWQPPNLPNNVVKGNLKWLNLFAIQVRVKIS